MIEAQVQSTADGAILHDAACGVASGAAWFEPGRWPLAAGADTGGRGGVPFLVTPVGTCALRHYRRGGLVARLVADRYLWTGAERTRAFREFRLLATLADAGLPVAQPVAARYVRAGAWYRADLLTRRIEHARTLARQLETEGATATLAARVGETIACFHVAGAWHADLNANNIMIDRRGTAWLIDFDRGRLRSPHASWQQANLSRLRRSLAKLGLDRGDGFEQRFWTPLLQAHRERLAAGGAHGASP
jgi:3-deoxy-D-manno-octulosonic acid kinase